MEDVRTIIIWEDFWSKTSFFSSNFMAFICFMISSVSNDELGMSFKRNKLGAIINGNNSSDFFLRKHSWKAAAF